MIKRKHLRGNIYKITIVETIKEKQILKVVKFELHQDQNFINEKNQKPIQKVLSVE